MVGMSTSPSETHRYAVRVIGRTPGDQRKLAVLAAELQIGSVAEIEQRLSASDLIARNRSESDALRLVRQLKSVGVRGEVFVPGATTRDSPTSTDPNFHAIRRPVAAPPPVGLVASPELAREAFPATRPPRVESPPELPVVLPPSRPSGGQGVVTPERPSGPILSMSDSLPPVIDGQPVRRPPTWDAPTEAQRPSASPVRWILALALVAAAVAAVVWLRRPEPHNPVVDLERARVALKARDYFTAHEALQQARQGGITGALIEEVECSLRAAPALDLADALVARGDLVGARAQVEAARLEAPEDPRMFRLLTDLERRAGRPDPVAPESTRAVPSEPPTSLLAAAALIEAAAPASAEAAEAPTDREVSRQERQERLRARRAAQARAMEAAEVAEVALAREVPAEEAPPAAPESVAAAVPESAAAPESLAAPETLAAPGSLAAAAPVTEAAPAEVAVQLAKPDVPAEAEVGPLEMGFLSASAVVRAEVYVDGRRLGGTPLWMVKVPAGRRLVELRDARGAIIERQTVQVLPKQMASVLFRRDRAE